VRERLIHQPSPAIFYQPNDRARGVANPIAVCCRAVLFFRPVCLRPKRNQPAAAGFNCSRTGRRCSSHASVTWRVAPDPDGVLPTPPRRDARLRRAVSLAHGTPHTTRRPLLWPHAFREPGKPSSRPPRADAAISGHPTKPLLLRRRLSFSAARRGSGRGSRRRGVSRGSAEVFVGD